MTAFSAGQPPAAEPSDWEPWSGGWGFLGSDIEWVLPVDGREGVVRRVVMRTGRENSGWATSVADQMDGAEVQLGGELFRQNSTTSETVSHHGCVLICETHDDVIV